MGVPITFLDKYNPNQFEILGMDRPIIKELTGRQSRFLLKGKEQYARILIRTKEVQKWERMCISRYETRSPDTTQRGWVRDQMAEKIKQYPLLSSASLFIMETR